METVHRVTIASPPDRSSLVAELFFGDIQWAELRSETDQVVVEFYSRPDGKPWLVELNVAINALEEANARLKTVLG